MNKLNKGIEHHLNKERCESVFCNKILHKREYESCKLNTHSIKRCYISPIEKDMEVENIDDSLFPGISEINIKLDPSTFSEIQWIGEPETGLMIQGSARITVLNEDGDARMMDLQVGDIWDFMPGYRYTIKILDMGCVFKLYLKNSNIPQSKTSGYQIDGSLYIKL